MATTERGGFDKNKGKNELEEYLDKALYRSEEDEEEEEDEQKRTQSAGNENALRSLQTQNPMEAEMDVSTRPTLDLGEKVRNLYIELSGLPDSIDEPMEDLNLVLRGSQRLIFTIDQQMPSTPNKEDIDRWMGEMSYWMNMLNDSNATYVETHDNPPSRLGKKKKTLVYMMMEETSRMKKRIEDGLPNAMNIAGGRSWGQAIAASLYSAKSNENKDMRRREYEQGVQEQVSAEEGIQSLVFSVENPYELLQNGFEAVRGNPDKVPDPGQDTNMLNDLMTDADDIMMRLTNDPVNGEEDEMLKNMDELLVIADKMVNNGSSYLTEHKYVTTPEEKARKTGVACMTKFSEILLSTRDQEGNKLIRAYINDIQDVVQQTGKEKKTVGLSWLDLIRQYLGPDGVSKWNGSAVI